MKEAPWHEEGFVVGQDRLSRRRRGTAKTFLMACVLGVLGAFVLASVGQLGFAAALLTSALACLTLSLKLEMKAQDFRRRLRNDFEAARLSVGGFLGEVQIYQGPLLTAVDRGMIWFEDQVLYFAGSQTSFGINSGQVVKAKSPSFPVKDLAPTHEVVLDHQTDFGSLRVGFEIALVKLPDAPYWLGDAQFRQAIQRWKASDAKEDCTEVAHLPPLCLTEYLPSKVDVIGPAVLSAGAWIAAAIGAVLALLHFGVVGLFGVFAITVFLTLSTILQRPLLRIQAMVARLKVKDVS